MRPVSSRRGAWRSGCKRSPSAWVMPPPPWPSPTRWPIPRSPASCSAPPALIRCSRTPRPSVPWSTSARPCSRSCAPSKFGHGRMDATAAALYRWLVLARELDRAICDLSPRWFPLEGEEATVVGSFVDLRPDDAAAPHYRDPFVVYLMRGAEMWRLAAQVLGKAAGYNKGRSVPFNGPVELGLVPWVAGDLGTTLG